MTELSGGREFLSLCFVVLSIVEKNKKKKREKVRDTSCSGLIIECSRVYNIFIYSLELGTLTLSLFLFYCSISIPALFTQIPHETLRGIRNDGGAGGNAGTTVQLPLALLKAASAPPSSFVLRVQEHGCRALCLCQSRVFKLTVHLEIRFTTIIITHRYRI